MSVIYVLLAISIAVALLFFIAFIVSVSRGQYDDSYTPSVRMLFEDELVKPMEKKRYSSGLENLETNPFEGKVGIENREVTKLKKVSYLNSMFSSLKKNPTK